MINRNRLQIYLDTLARETGALQEALTLSDQQILTMPLLLGGLKNADWLLIPRWHSASWRGQLAMTKVI